MNLLVTVTRRVTSHSKNAHWLRDILEPLWTQVLKGIWRVSAYVVEKRFAYPNVVGLRSLLNASRYVYAVAGKTAFCDDDISEMNADAQFWASVSYCDDRTELLCIS